MHDFAAEKREALIGYLRRNVEGEIRFDDPSRRLYSTDASIYQMMPMGVVVPRTIEALKSAVQIALETRTPITSRGGGTSLTGQSIGPGIVIDCSKYLNRILDVDATGRMVRVQPGVVLDHLNKHLVPQNLLFGPDVATANRATIGGMLGNNSAGSRSVKYGQTVHHVRSLNAVLSDGQSVTLRELSVAEHDIQLHAKTVEGAGWRALEDVLSKQRAEIVKRFPNILRRVSGYNLAAYLPEFHDARYVDGPPTRSMIPLVVGSEGTLAVLTEAELHLVPRPAVRGLLVPHFNSLRSALDAVGLCLEFQPSAVELLDAMLIRLARDQRSLQTMMAAIHDTPEALLMVEFVGDSEAEVADRIEKLQHRLREVPGLTACVPAMNAELRDPLWNLRSAAMPLLYGMPGDRKPVTFVEDCAVAPAKMPEFADRFRELLRQHGTDGAFYGHASVGCLHIRPVLNLKDADDVTRMRQITDDVTKLVLEFNGSLSGEHGDGFCRSEWNRTMYGDAIEAGFRQIKAAFDPHNLLNPGKIVHAPPMTENLRYSPAYQPIALPLVFDYSKQKGFFSSVELCNGAGVCRKTQGGAMCPSFRATRDEQDNTRGRANALRLAITHQTPDDKTGKSPLAQRWLHDVMDLCLSCKACKTECPSNVDMAKLKAEFQHAYHAEHGRPLGHRLVRHIHQLNAIGSWMAPLANWMNRRRAWRWFFELLTGYDRRRPMPMFHRRHFRKWFRNRPPSFTPKTNKVLLFDDCLTTFNEPNIGRAAVGLLEAAGCEVELVNPICCGRAMLSKGYLAEVKELVTRQAADLAKRITPDTVILGWEPSCVLTLSDEWSELLPGEDTRKIAAAVQLADHWLAAKLASGELSLPLKGEPTSCTFHGHCHQRALVGVAGSASLLKQVPGLSVKTLDAGCCGMAGAFGYEKKHYDVSVKIAGLELLPALKTDEAGIIAATGTSCRHQIEDLAGREAMHPLEVLWKATGL
ncbi:FAD-binding and (Fe-S)-binding domain-containing protein [Zavarzinella formosa]|uniref:FAD-binding and (Fe-S)-binding domain-containing protein n=1 Tax=Zavarzinella formosa TaxID=360055 RepID=UPI0003603BF3|nr:FAD-binding and (Fe-S)-binding domain-containing protein [Zavarzinella formosa]